MIGLFTIDPIITNKQIIISARSIRFQQDLKYIYLSLTILYANILKNTSKTNSNKNASSTISS